MTCSLAQVLTIFDPNARVEHGQTHRKVANEEVAAVTMADKARACHRTSTRTTKTSSLLYGLDLYMYMFQVVILGEVHMDVCGPYLLSCIYVNIDVGTLYVFLFYHVLT